jgi:putative ABC transport system ATP-binding protein/lipoprotein-releasing system ATP-binding protein
MSIVAHQISKEIGSPPTRVLTDISLRVDEGEFIALTGRSGSGKSTLLYLLSSLDQVSAGSIQIEDQNLTQMSTVQLERFRNEKIGFVFQFHYLIAELTALENVLLPATKVQQEKKRRAFAEDLLAQFGLGAKGHRLPRQLSGGEQQRVAIARSLVMEPKYLFADEPTGALDSVNGELVMKILRESNEKRGTAIILVTHDPDFAKLARRQIFLADGRIVSETRL